MTCGIPELVKQASPESHTSLMTVDAQRFSLTLDDAHNQQPAGRDVKVKASVAALKHPSPDDWKKDSEILTCL